MALSVGSALVRGGIFSLSEAERAFSPWWDQLESYLIFSVAFVGLFALPTANGIMECSKVYKNESSPAHTAFVNKYCTRENLSLYVSYFPYFMLSSSVFIIVLQKYFSSITSGGIRMRRFYSLLIEDTIQIEGVSALFRSSQKDIKELRSEFRKSRSFFVAFAVKNFVELILLVGFGTYLIFYGNSSIYDWSDSSIVPINYKECQLAKVSFTCILPQTHFYLYLLVFVLAANLVFILTKAYTLAWLLAKPLRRLSNVLIDYRRTVAKHSKPHKWDKERNTVHPTPTELLQRLNSLDVELLLDLLAETMGVATAMRALILLDQEFYTAWRAQNLKHEVENLGCLSASLTFESATIARHLRSLSKSTLFYLVSISPLPPGEEDGPRIFLHEPDQSLTESEVAEGRMVKKHQYNVEYARLEPGTSYRVTVTTSYGGKDVAESHVDLTTRPLPPRDLTTRWGFDVKEGTLFFTAKLDWTPVGECYRVEIAEGQLKLTSEVCDNSFKHLTEGNRDITVRVWTLLGGRGGGCDADQKTLLESERCLERKLDPLPSLTRDYVSGLVAKMSPEAVGSKYLFQVDLFKQVAKELKELYTDVQLETVMNDVPPSAVAKRRNLGSRKKRESTATMERGGDADADSVDEAADIYLGRTQRVSQTSLRKDSQQQQEELVDVED